MLNRCWYVLPLITAAAFAQNSAGTGVRFIFGVTDTQPTKWNGKVKAQGAQVTAIEPWRFEGEDVVPVGEGWQLQLHNIRLFGGGNQFGLGRLPLVSNGVVVRLSSSNPDVNLHVETLQGNFDVRLADIPYGKTLYALSGRVMFDRVPPSTRITSNTDEQDYPAAATDKNGNVWLAYVDFKHNKDHNKLRANYRTPPPDFPP